MVSFRLILFSFCIYLLMFCLLITFYPSSLWSKMYIISPQRFRIKIGKAWNDIFTKFPSFFQYNNKETKRQEIHLDELLSLVLLTKTKQVSSTELIICLATGWIVFHSSRLLTTISYKGPKKDQYATYFYLFIFLVILTFCRPGILS